MKKTIVLLALFICMSASMICCVAYGNIVIPFSDFAANGFSSSGVPQYAGASISKSINIPADGYYVAVFNATSSRGTSDAGNLYLGSFRATVPIYRTAIFRSAQDNHTQPFFVKKGTYNLDFVCHDTDVAISSVTLKYVGKGYDQIEKAVGEGNRISYRVNAPHPGYYDIRLFYYCHNGCNVFLDGENINLPATFNDYFSVQVRHYLDAGEQDIVIESINGMVYTEDLTIIPSTPIVVPATFAASRLEGGFKAYIKDAIGNRTIDTVCGIVDGGYADYTVVAKTAGTYWLSVAYSARTSFNVQVKVNNNEHAFSVADTKEIDWQWSSQLIKITLNEGENKIRVYNSTPNDLRIYYLEINNQKRTYDENLGKECYIEPITVYTDKGEEPYLPAALTYRAADGNIVTRRISWNRISPDSYATDGVFYADGNPEEMNTLVMAKVIVGEGNRASNKANPVQARIKGSGLWSEIPAEAEIRLYNNTENTKKETVFLCVYDNERLQSVKTETFEVAPFDFDDVIMQTDENITSPDTQKVSLFVWNSDGTLTTDFQGDTLQGAAKGLPVLGIDPPLIIAQSMTNEEKANILTGEYYGKNNVSGTIRSIPRFGIKEMLLPDGPSGLRIDRLENTVFPVRYPSGFNQASSWDPKVSYEIGRGLGYQGASNDIALLLGPGMNIYRSIFNGRNFEYYSEDPYLTGVQAAAYVNGMQGVGMGATIKHFAANNAEAWRGSASSNLSERALREIYLKGFELVVRDAQPWGVMTAYNGINGEHTSHNVDLIVNILRNEWGYKYLTMSDWWGYRDARWTLNAGNITMPDAQNGGRVNEALAQINAGNPNLENMNEGIAGIVRTAEKTTHYNKYFTSHDANSIRLIQVARETGADTMVLLKNEDKTLPMAEGSKVALFGHGAVHTVLGGLGSGDVTPEWQYNYTSGLSERYQLNSTIYNKYANLPGYDTNSMVTANPIDDSQEITISDAEARTAAAESEYAVIVISRYTVEGVDHENRPGDYYLSSREYDLIYKVSNAFHAAGKKVAVVLNVTFPMEIMSWRDSVDAILLSGFLSQEPGKVLADVLTGDVTPSGKLPNTWPTTFESTPAYNNPYGNAADITYIDDVFVGYRYFETFDVPVAYEFGYGLSYTDFVYTDASFDGTLENGDLTVTVTIKNTGNVAGREVVQLYGNMPDGIYEHAAKELVAYGKTKLLQPGESETLKLTVDLLAIKAYDTKESRWYLEEGTYTWYVGASVRDIKFTFTTNCNNLVVIQDVSNQCEPNYEFPTATKDTIDLVNMPNVAAGKAATCFSNEAEHPAHHAVDDNYLSRWARGGAEGDTNLTWLQVDLAYTHLVNRIILLYEASSENLIVKYSQDGNTWYTYANEKGNHKDIQIINTNFVARYIRLYFDCSRYASVYELIVNGTAFSPHNNNAALGTTVTSSAAEDSHVASHITDGNLETRWSASLYESMDDRHAIIDLEQVMPLNEFVIYWEATNGNYSIETATDSNGPWTKIFTNDTAHSESMHGMATRFYDGNGINARFIRINGDSEGFFSIYELVVLAPMQNLALGKTATASSSEKAYVPSNANDGYILTRWSGFNSALAQNSNGTYDWWQVDLEKVYDISQIGLFWENISMADYYVVVSESENGPWTRVLSNDEANNAVVNVSCKARYVRVYMTRETYHSLMEVQIFGK